MQIDKDLLQYCKDKEFPITEMTTENFKSVENILDFKFYKLGLAIRDLADLFKNIKYKKKDCKTKQVNNNFLL